MSIIKFIERLKRMDDLIYRQATGTAKEFAERLGVSVSVLKENISQLRALGADIEFCRVRKSYIYKRSGRLLLKFSGESMANNDASLVRGGISFNFFRNRLMRQDDEFFYLYQHSLVR